MTVLFFFGLICITSGLFLIFFVIFCAFKIKKNKQNLSEKKIKIEQLRTEVGKS